MGSSKKAKVKSRRAAKSDRLSSLPLEIKADILSRLNVQDAVRTNILSSAWRSTWTTIPEMLLCDCTYTSCQGSVTSAPPKFITLVDMVLSLHRGPLHGITILGSKNYHDVFGRWMHKLSMKSPNSVTIKLTSASRYRIPSCFFSISDLEHLDIKNCIISLPQMFKGFEWLTTLDLENFSSTDSDIDNLISCCPELSVLVLKSFEGISCLNIRAPELEILEVDGKFEDFHLDAPNLETANVTLHKAQEYQSVPVVHCGKSYLKQALGSLSDIEKLVINGYFLTYLSKGCIMTKIPAVFDHLEMMLLEICFWDQREILTGRSFPWDNDFGPMSLWDQDQTSIADLTLQMDHLVTVSVNDFLGLDYEVDFVGKLLSWAPVLEEVKINVDCTRAFSLGSKVLKKLLALPRVSDKAKIIVT
uniref:F-box domain-containing protein n=1 Tax=Oryza nivara TaxID=4536 RepID=A0A0E0I049_ORYNI